ncbi:hypothetical protein Fmac_011850 [Flemingia macrophylla]|uniref:Reverse transcriptase zinc-binding domain-containing protein n=1 Tax=Flemingia macrophylla TaxID=520843 RepID=A0ABD1MNM4_9FABA
MHQERLPYHRIDGVMGFRNLQVFNHGFKMERGCACRPRWLQVRLAYHGYLENELDVSALRKEGKWNLTWSLEVPPRVWSFLWRLCQVCLPTQLNEYFVYFVNKGWRMSGMCSLDVRWPHNVGIVLLQFYSYVAKWPSKASIFLHLSIILYVEVPFIAGGSFRLGLGLKKLVLLFENRLRFRV